MSDEKLRAVVRKMNELWLAYRASSDPIERATLLALHQSFAARLRTAAGLVEAVAS